MVVVLGFFLPPVSIILMTAPIILPPLKAAGFDLIWFGVIMTIVMEMGLIHPPVGLNIFVINNIAPDIPLRDVMWGVLPFVGLMMSGRRDIVSGAGHRHMVSRPDHGSRNSKMNTSFFGELLQTISERGRALLARDRRGDASARSESLVELCEDLLSGRGEASGVALAREILGRYAELTTGPRIAFFEALARALRHRSSAHGAGDRRLAGESVGRDRRRSPCRLGAAPAGTVSPAQSRAGRHRRAGAHARAADGFARSSARIWPPSMPISSICSRPGSIAAFWCCAGSTGRRRRSCWRRSSATRRSTRSATGTICAAASIRRTGAASPSSIRRWWTSR